MTAWTDDRPIDRAARVGSTAGRPIDPTTGVGAAEGRPIDLAAGVGAAARRRVPAFGVTLASATVVAITAAVVVALVAVAAVAVVAGRPGLRAAGAGAGVGPLAGMIAAPASGSTGPAGAMAALRAASPLTTPTLAFTPSPTYGTPAGPTGTPGPGSTLPNLVPVSGDWWELGQAASRYCVSPSGPPGGLSVCVVNDGASASGPFTLAADTAPGTVLASTGGLLPGEEVCLLVNVPPDAGIVVDPSDAVVEASEDDNWFPPVPVPPGGAPRPRCEPTATPAPGTPTAVPGRLPELTGWGWWWMDVGPHGCVHPGDPQVWRSELTVVNWGDADAGAFRVAENASDMTIASIPDLPAGAIRRRDALQSPQAIRIDPDDAVVEQDESNNLAYIPVPTQAPTCTPGPTPTPFPRPDVVVERAEVRAMGFDEVCVPVLRPVQVYVRVGNHGNGDAEGITVDADGYRPGWPIRRLRPGQTIDLQPVDPPVHWVRARPLQWDDPSNNARRVMMVTLTPPPICTAATPTETPTTTLTPIEPTVTPTATSGAARALLPWASQRR